MIDGVDHVAVAVQDLNAGLPYYVERLGLPLLGREELPETGVRVVYLRADTVTLQLVQPLGAGRLPTSWPSKAKACTTSASPWRTSPGRSRRLRRGRTCGSFPAGAAGGPAACRRSRPGSAWS